jgi:hypothetical protein
MSKNEAPALLNELTNVEELEQKVAPSAMAEIAE